MRAEDFESLLASSERIVGYDPMSDEPDFRAYLAASKVDASIVFIPKDRTQDPFTVAERLAKQMQGKRVIIFVPGTAFDASGTRHGRGEGWYDRFLSRVPADWIRVGVIVEERFSETPLIREEWDEPVDYVLVLSRGWDMMATGARPVTWSDAAR